MIPFRGLYSAEFFHCIETVLSYQFKKSQLTALGRAFFFSFLAYWGSGVRSAVFKKNLKEKDTEHERTHVFCTLSTRMMPYTHAPRVRENIVSVPEVRVTHITLLLDKG